MRQEVGTARGADGVTLGLRRLLRCDRIEGGDEEKPRKQQRSWNGEIPHTDTRFA
jgi:putative component of membrane protein insertase Oxa1/YidC/SpoIIIJ protein YidD